MRNLDIGGRKIGEEHPCFIIAEAGLNHNGDLKTAKDMIDAAKECGVDAIKFQTFKTDEFISDKKQVYKYKTQGRVIAEPMYSMFKRYEFGAREFKALSDYCKKRKMIFFSTPQNVSDLELLLKIGVPAIKVGSDDLTNLPLLKAYAARKLPLLISTGMSYLSEVAEAVQVIQEFNNRIGVFLCVSSYPAKYNECHLNRLTTLKMAFPEVIIGFSDHTIGTLAAIGAVTLGAKMLEKHFTLDKNMHGPDHRFSADPEELSRLVQNVRDIEKALGSSGFRLSANEKKMRGMCHRSIVAARNIAKGSIIRMPDLVLKRPGSGIPPKDMVYVISRQAAKNIYKDQIIKMRDLK